jgi:hypothetical protein
MNDCTNAEIRDQLPDLLHDRLTVSVRELVVAHVADCADCREELDVLRDMRSALLARTPLVDIGQIVASLPKATGGRIVPAAGIAPITSAPSRRRMRIDWRIAAAVTFLAVGGSSVALLERTPSPDRGFPDSSIVASMPSGAVPTNGSGVGAAVPASVQASVDSVGGRASAELASTDNPGAVDAQAAADVSPGGRFAGLTETQLKALLSDIGQLPDVPVTEPAPVSIEVNTTSGTGGI